MLKKSQYMSVFETVYRNRTQFYDTTFWLKPPFHCTLIRVWQVSIWGQIHTIFTSEQLGKGYFKRKYCKRIQIGCVFYLSFLAEYGVRWIKFITKCKIYMYINMYIQKCAKSNIRLLLNNYIPPNIVHDKYNTYIGILLKKLMIYFVSSLPQVLKSYTS